MIPVYDLAVDIDGTITQEDNYPSFGQPNKFVVAMLQYYHKQGRTICLYSCRLSYPNDYVQMSYYIALWCDNWNIPYDYIWIDKGKPFASNYLDDRNLTFPAFYQFDLWDDMEYKDPVFGEVFIQEDDSE